MVSLGASSWRNTGTPGLVYWNVHDDVTLEGGALVKHRLKYRYFVNASQEYNNVDLTPLLVSEASRVQLPLQHTPLATCLSTSCGV